MTLKNGLVLQVEKAIDELRERKATVEESLVTIEIELDEARALLHSIKTAPTILKDFDSAMAGAAESEPVSDNGNESAIRTKADGSPSKLHNEESVLEVINQMPPEFSNAEFQEALKLGSKEGARIWARKFVEHGILEEQTPKKGTQGAKWYTKI